MAEHWHKLSQNRGRSVVKLLITAGWSKNKGLRQARPSGEEGAPWRKHSDTEATEAQNRRGSSKLTGKRGEQMRFDDHGCSADGGGSAVAMTQLEEESGFGG
ncbi:hypothetical protein S245_033036 [Arachis hypogaea]